jgi:aminodeoxyfutalosine deaminase
MFARHVGQARELGYRATVHAGESTGPATIWSALRDLKADRIGHGVTAIADPDLVTHLALTGIPLEICPTSNLRTNVVTDPAGHPVLALLRAGVTITLGTDAPGDVRHQPSPGVRVCRRPRRPRPRGTSPDCSRGCAGFVRS